MIEQNKMEKKNINDICDVDYHLYAEMLQRDKVALENRISSFISKELDIFAKKYNIPLKDIIVETNQTVSDINDEVGRVICSTMQVETNVNIKL